MQNYLVAKTILTPKHDEAELTVRCFAMSKEVKPAEFFKISVQGSLKGLSQFKEKLEISKTIMVDDVSIYTRVGTDIFDHPAKNISVEKIKRPDHEKGMTP